MVIVRLLGGFEVALIDGSTLGRLGSKPQGLLAFLAMNRGVAIPRGRLAGLLWGERDEERARHSLSQALTTIRTALGPAAALLDACPDSVEWAAGGFDLDVEAFERAARSQDPSTLQQASDLYRGAFLDGGDIREHAFEEWMLSERYRLGTLAAEVLARLLDLQITARETEAAIATARRLVAIAPLDEQAHARLIALYGAQGQPALAEAHYAHCASLLRSELDQEPGEALRGALRAARRCAAGTAIGPQPAPKAMTAFAVPRTASQRTKAWVAAAAAGAVLLMLGAVWGIHESSVGGAGDGSSYAAVPWELPAEPSIAVLPFQNLSADPEQAYFADGVTNDIITDLSKFSGLFVTASDASFRYRDHATKVQDVARNLGVRYVLKGSIRRADDRLWINAALVDATTGRHVWAQRYERPTEDLFAAQKEITRAIVGTVGSTWGELQRAELERIARVPTEDLQAYEFYLRGIAFNQSKNKENNTLARQMFERAIEADPYYAIAMAECSLTHVNDIFNRWSDSPDEALRKAEDLARRAIELDSSEPWGFVALGVVYQLKGLKDKALPLFEMAHALNPNDYDVRIALGYAMTQSGSAERAVELLEQAQQLDPYNPGAPRYITGAYFFAHRYEDALTAVNKVTRRENTLGHWLFKAAVHAALGQHDEADGAVAEALELKPKITLRSEHERQLALGLDPAYARHLIEALRKAGLPEAAVP